MDTVTNRNMEAELVKRVVSKVERSLTGVIDKPSRAKWFLLGAALGALGVVFLDPVNGQKRRAMVRETLTDWSGKLQDVATEQFSNLQETAHNVTEKFNDVTGRHH